MEVNYSANKTYRYVYDTFGNIRIKKTYNSTSYTTVAQADAATPASTVDYTYGNSTFKDLLTKYGNTTISYDNLGNPSSWTDGSTLTWADTRRLASYTNATNIVTYSYNSDDLRTSKTVNGVTYNYYYNGTQLAVQEWTDANSVTRTLHFIYDASDAPYAVVYDNETNEYVYYYITDLQGNVVSIVSRYMNVMAYYEYDAWGNVISVTNGSGTPVTGGTTIAYVNPILYRGYYYDRETSLYYLQTRYYDPAVGRFLNADGFTTTGSFVGYNMFAYCNNSPVITEDSSGCMPIRNTAVMVSDSGTSPIECKLQVILNKKVYSKETWESASINERKEILCSHVQEVSKVLGVIPIICYQLFDMN